MNDARIQYVPENVSGRDFIVGDIHGMLTLLQALLKHVRFNPDTDRLFSVGDLVDRGEESSETLELLNIPWFHATLGNHEVLLLDYLKPKNEQRFRFSDGDHAFLYNGGQYWFPNYELSRNTRKVLENLPHVLVVGKDSPSRFNIVHASLVRKKEERSSGPFFHFYSDNDIDSGLVWDEFRYIPGFDAIGNTQDSLTWDRSLPPLFRDIKRGKVSPKTLFPSNMNLSSTYCGHTPVKHPVSIAGHRFIDTGGFMAEDEEHGLSLALANCKDIWKAKINMKDYSVEIISETFKSLD